LKPAEMGEAGGDGRSWLRWQKLAEVAEAGRDDKPRRR
tara:strand:+ start:402 stop:515 length:114 start_codon:yes stop_codon:yes gene_type:complete